MHILFYILILTAGIITYYLVGLKKIHIAESCMNVRSTMTYELFQDLHNISIDTRTIHTESNSIGTMPINKLKSIPNMLDLRAYWDKNYPNNIQNIAAHFANQTDVKYKLRIEKNMNKINLSPIEKYKIIKFIYLIFSLWDDEKMILIHIDFDKSPLLTISHTPQQVRDQLLMTNLSPQVKINQETIEFHVI